MNGCLTGCDSLHSPTMRPRRGSVHRCSGGEVRRKPLSQQVMTSQQLAQERSPRFALYVEGPRDRGVIEAWAQRMSRRLRDQVADAAVILGGRQPERAEAHFRGLVPTENEPLRGLCILDRDDQPIPREPLDSGPGLQIFTWPRRHIESYLLVPAAIARSLRLPADDLRVERYFRAELPHPNDEQALRTVDAKSLFAPNGPLATIVGRPIRAIHVARAMHRQELHRDVVGVLRWIRDSSFEGPPRA
jgi:hypothetical protein